MPRISAPRKAPASSRRSTRKAKPKSGTVGAVSAFIEELVRDLPAKAFANPPVDGSTNHDHYLSCAVKRVRKPRR